MDLILLRHPPVAVTDLCYGFMDVPLSEDHGTAVAAALKDTARPGRLISSPSARCRVLAEALAIHHDLALEIDPRLRELNFGDWEGVPWTKIKRGDSDPWAEDPMNRRPPGGETFAELTSRVHSAAREAEGATLITHSGPIRALWMQALGLSFDEAFSRKVPFARPLRLSAANGGD